MGKLYHFLEIEVLWHESGIHLTQTKYINDLLKRFELQNVKPCIMPIPAGKSMSKTEGKTLKNPTIYRSAVRGFNIFNTPGQTSLLP